jgi:hypothetical protein
MTPLNSEAVFRLVVELEDVKPRVRRELLVPLSLTFAELHSVLQIAFGWEDAHLYEFQVDRTRVGTSEPDGLEPGVLHASKTKLSKLVGSSVRKFHYIYDFGDEWVHALDVTQTPAKPGEIYPKLVEAEGRCPPEDVGGPFGYAEFLAALADPKHPSHDEWAEWYDGDYDPLKVDIAAIRKDLAAYAKHLHRAPAKGSRIAGPAVLDTTRIDDAVLALLYLSLHEEDRAWKTLDWDALDRLHKKGFISQPQTKSKSVAFSADGLERAARLFETMFTKR